MHIKDRVIKLLGGFTKDEVFGSPISKMQFVTRQHSEIVTLKAAVNLPKELSEKIDDALMNTIRDRLAHMFADQIVTRTDLMPITRSNRLGFDVDVDVFSATIKMVEQQGGE